VAERSTYVAQPRTGPKQKKPVTIAQRSRRSALRDGDAKQDQGGADEQVHEMTSRARLLWSQGDNGQ
jgi:hypothetical protein